MKVSQLFIRTLRETPNSAELPSHIFLLRGGYIKQVASGLYSVMPLGKRILNKIVGIVREEMNAIGGQEIELPLVQPSELWDESGRNQVIGDELLRFKDRVGHPMVLAMTHEEAVTDLARSVINSYKQLPFVVYQFQLKFRDEPRPRGGLIRVREFVMKDAYSFHHNQDNLDSFYTQAYQAYERIFKRVGIKPVIVQSDTGIMGGKLAHEFMLETEHGEDCLIIGEESGYAANQEIAEFDRESQPHEMKPLEKVATPNKKTIEEVSNFLTISPKETMKMVFYDANPGLICIVLRGDLNASDTKIKNYLKVPGLSPANEEQIRSAGMEPGYASPLNIEQTKGCQVLVDISIQSGSNFVGGANEEGFHYRNVNFGRDFNSQKLGDFAIAEEGHLCSTGKGRLKAIRGIEIGNIFKLGTKFSESMKCNFLDDKGKQNPAIMGCYGIGIGRLMASVCEKYHDDFGPVWPKSIAPFHIHLVSIGQDEPVLEACTRLYQELLSQGHEVLFDDRDERPGVKFKDGDLWGIPLRLAISKKTLENQQCEFKPRSAPKPELIGLEQVKLNVTDFLKQD